MMADMRHSILRVGDSGCVLTLRACSECELDQHPRSNGKELGPSELSIASTALYRLLLHQSNPRSLSASSSLCQQSNHVQAKPNKAAVSCVQYTDPLASNNPVSVG